MAGIAGPLGKAVPCTTPGPVIRSRMGISIFAIYFSR